MARRSLIEQLDEAVEAVMANPDAPLPRVSAPLAALLRIAADLRDLPSREFKARLKADLLSPQRAARASKQQRTARAQRKIAAGSKVQPVREGFHTATPCLIVRGAPSAIEFYKKAFGATELMRLADPSTGKLWHAEVQIGDSLIAIADEDPEYNLSPQSLGGSPAIISLYVEDVDALADQAIAAGAKVVFPVADQFYGDRAGRLADPFGHLWIIATHKENVPHEEMQRRAEAYSREQGGDGAHKDEATTAVKPIREGFHSVTPFLIVQDGARLIDFLKQAFAAQEVLRTTAGGHLHAEVRIGDSIVELGEPTGQFGPMPTAIHLYVDDADAVYKRALRASAASMQEPTDQYYGDREAGVKDPFGNHWYIATHKAGVPAEEPRRRPGAPAKQQRRRPRAAVSYVPEGLRSVTPYLHPQRAAKVIDFLKQAFDAEEVFRAQSPTGTIAHAKVRIGDSMVEMGEAHGEFQPMPGALHLFVNDADATYQRALRAGAASMYEPTDKFYGDREAAVKDPFGDVWIIGTHKKDLSPEELAKREGVKQQRAAKEKTVEASEAGAAVRPLMPFLYIRDAVAALEFYKKVLGATELMREVDPSGIVSHAQIKAGDARIMIRDPSVGLPAEYVAKGLSRTAHELGGTPVHLYLYVEDVDKVFNRALAAGAKVVDALGDKEWGDRCGGFQDPFGHIWYIATPIKDAPR